MTDKFAPRNDDERNEALRWILFDNHKFTSYFATYRFMKSLRAAGARSDVMAFLKGRFDAAGGIVDRHLAKPQIHDRATSRPSPTSRWRAICSSPSRNMATTGPRAIPNIHAWTERMRALPGWKDPYELLPGQRIKPLR